jgi:hypothetical protein
MTRKAASRWLSDIEGALGNENFLDASGLALAILLGGCSILSQFSTQRPNYPTQVDWSKKGVSSHETAVALSDCLSQARAATERDTNISNDIMATRQNNWSNTGPQPVGTQNQYFPTADQLFDKEDQNLTNSIIKNCMIDKSFVPTQ